VVNIGVLQLVNEFVDTSISRIVQQIVQHSDHRAYTWHVGMLGGAHTLWNEFRAAGAAVVDFSQGQGKGSTRQRLRAYIQMHNIAVVHSHLPRADIIAAASLPQRGRPVHISTKHLLYGVGDRRWGALYAFVDRCSLYAPDHIVAVSTTMSKQIAAYPGLPPSRVRCIRNAVECDVYYRPELRDACRRELGLDATAPLIGFTGRVEKMKRLDVLLHAFVQVVALHPQARLLIVGDGSLKPALQKLANDLGIAQAVIWVGFRQDIARFLAAMDVYVQPSANEGLSLSILEAMSAAKPVVATRVGGVAEVIDEGSNGLLVSPGSSLALQQAIVALLARPDRREAMAQAGRAQVVNEFAVHRMVGEYCTLYSACVERRQLAPSLS
jgi:glycosyltransferase involved in cell wall biosynthesis